MIFEIAYVIGVIYLLFIFIWGIDAQDTSMDDE